MRNVDLRMKNNIVAVFDLSMALLGVALLYWYSCLFLGSFSFVLFAEREDLFCLANDTKSTIVVVPLPTETGASSVERSYSELAYLGLCASIVGPWQKTCVYNNDRKWRLVICSTGSLRSGMAEPSFGDADVHYVSGMLLPRPAAASALLPLMGELSGAIVLRSAVVIIASYWMCFVMLRLVCCRALVEIGPKVHRRDVRSWKFMDMDFPSKVLVAVLVLVLLASAVDGLLLLQQSTIVRTVSSWVFN